MRARVSTSAALVVIMALLSPATAAARDSDAGGAPGGASIVRTGTVRVVQGDPTPGSGLPHRTRYFLHEGDGSVTELAIGAAEVRRLGGWIRIDGGRFAVSGSARADGSMRVASLSRASGATAAAPAHRHAPGTRPHSHGAAAAAAVTLDVGSEGTVRFAMLLCRFADSTGAPPRDRAWFEQLMGTTEPAMDHYWRAQSYGRIDLTGAVIAGWLTLAGNRSDYVPEEGDADLDSLMADCTAAADKQGFDFSKVAGVNMAFDRPLDGAAWGGGSTLALDGPRRSVGAVWIGSDHMSSQNFWAHEMGHAFGMPHSGVSYDNQWDSMSGGGDTCVLSFATLRCVAPFTIMWHRDLPALDNPLRTILGSEWIPNDRKRIGGTGRQEFVLGYADTIAGTDPIYVKIPLAKDAVSEVFYTVEARRKVSYDRALPGVGVIIHRVNTANNAPAQFVDANTNGNSNDAGSAWTVGRTFTDAARGISVAVTEQTATGYRIVVSGPGGTDTTPPAVVAPTQAVTPGSPRATGETRVPTTVAWPPATDAGGSGVIRYELQESINGATFTDVLLPNAMTRSTVRSVRPGVPYQYRVRAHDAAGNVSAYVAGPRFVARVVEDSNAAIRFAGAADGGWAPDANGGYSGGTVKYTGAAGARAAFTFTGRHVAFMTTRYGQGGKAEIWLDGVRVAVVDTYAMSSSFRHVAFSRAVRPGVAHTIEVRVLGTAHPDATDPLVDVDAFVVLQ